MASKVLPTLILEVSVYDEYFDDSADVAVVQIDLKTYKWIKEAQKSVKKLKAHSVSMFDYSPEWKIRNEEARDRDIDKADLTLDNIEDYDGMRVDCLQMVVTNDVIRWEGSIKNTNIQMGVEGVTIKELDKYFKVLKEPLENMPTYIHDDDLTIKMIANERLKHGD